MDEDTAHDLYLQFKAVDAGARQKQGLGFGSNDVDWKRQGSTAFVKQRSRSPRGSSGAHAGRNRSKSPNGSGSRSSEDVDRASRKDRDDDGDARSSKRRHRRRRSGSGSRDIRRRGRRQRRRDESRGRSPSSSRGRSRSLSGSRSGGDRRRRRRSHSRSRSRLRSGSRRRYRRSRSRSRSRSRGRSRREREANDRRKSPRRRSEDRSQDSGGEDGGRGRPGNSRRGREGRRRDPSELIPGYESMSTMEKMKARTRMNLDAASRADRGEDKERQWTRFVFNNSAPLEEEGARPEMAFGGDSGDGGPINAVSFRSGEAEARAKARDISHEAAIFGSAPGAPYASGAAPQAPPSNVAVPTEPILLGFRADDAPTVVPAAEVSAPVTVASCAGGAAGRAPSWRERVAQQRQQQLL